jgi:hypothetical protein
MHQTKIKITLEVLTVTPSGHEIPHKFLKQTVHYCEHTIIPFILVPSQVVYVGFMVNKCTGAWLALTTCDLLSDYHSSIAVYSISSGASTASPFETVGPELSVTPHP